MSGRQRVGWDLEPLRIQGADHVREAIHSAFLFHAIQAGLDMGIVNAGQLAVYEDIGPELLELVEDLIFDRRTDATERLLDYAQRVEGDATKREVDLSWREQPVEKRLEHALVHGLSTTSRKTSRRRVALTTVRST